MVIASREVWAVVLRITRSADLAAIRSLADTHRCATDDLPEGPVSERNAYVTFAAHDLSHARAFLAEAWARSDVLGAYVRGEGDG